MTRFPTLAIGFLFAVTAAAADPPAVRVMTYNIRYGTAKDGDNHWDKRKTFLVETVKAFDPDLLGTQETLAFQRDALAKELAGHESFGVGRDDGKEAGEMAALFYRKDRFDKTDGGHFWLSETPEKVGSKGWDAALPRVVSWVKLRDKKDPGAKPILYLNTHFDHRGNKARAESARLIRKKLGDLGAGCAVVLTGDFNAGEGSDPYKSLYDPDGGKPSPVRDAYRTVRPKRETNEGTFSNFRATNVTGPRIDWIAVSSEWDVTTATIDRSAKEGRTPSDHFAVTAVVRRKTN